MSKGSRWGVPVDTRSNTYQPMPPVQRVQTSCELFLQQALLANRGCIICHASCGQSDHRASDIPTGAKRDVATPSLRGKGDSPRQKVGLADGSSFLGLGTPLVFKGTCKIQASRNMRPPRFGRPGNIRSFNEIPKEAHPPRHLQRRVTFGRKPTQGRKPTVSCPLDIKG